MKRIVCFSLCVFCSLILATCTNTEIPPTGIVSPTIQPVSVTPTVLSSPTSPATSTNTPSITLTPSAIPTHSLESLKDKLPSTPPTSGFVVLEMPQTVYWHDMITVTILTIPGADCQIYYFGTNGQSHAKGLE